jgi:steroid 5-alpha reductase family enzyme
MNLPEIWAAAGAIILGLMTALWLISLLLRDSSIVDSFWGGGFVLATWFYFAQTPDGSELRGWLIAAMVTIWGLRLSTYIFRRNWGRGEDPRYAKWRQEAGAVWWWRSFFKVFLLQGILMWVISLPLLAAQVSVTPAGLTILDVLGSLLWGMGFFFEALGDWQLARFKADPANRGKVLSSGVWRYSRHPNYFGEAAMWWGYFLVAAAAGGWWTVFSPVLMTVLLLRVSGVTLLERNLKQAKPQYREYIEATSEFIPWFPKRKRS